MSSKPCLYNLLVVADDEEKLHKMEPLLEMLLQRFPGKLITLLQKKGEKVLKTETKDPIPLLGSKTATEPRIAIEVSGIEEDKVALLPLSHLITDFPIILFWLPSSFQSLLFEKFYKLANRLIIDGEETPSLLYELTKGPLPVVDLAWSRGEGWRNVIREVFSSKHRMKSLEKCVQIEIAAVSGLPGSPLFFQAWLASSLHYEFVSKSSPQHLLYTYEGRKIEIHLSSKEASGLTEGSILEVKFTTSDKEECVISRGDEALEVKVHICTPETCDLPFTLYLPNPKRGGSFLSTWVWGDTHPVMLETLPLLEKILT